MMAKPTTCASWRRFAGGKAKPVWMDDEQVSPTRFDEQTIRTHALLKEEAAHLSYA
jgi:hypothetical protein